MKNIKQSYEEFVSKKSDYIGMIATSAEYGRGAGCGLMEAWPLIEPLLETMTYIAKNESTMDDMTYPCFAEQALDQFKKSIGAGDEQSR